MVAGGGRPRGSEFAIAVEADLAPRRRDHERRRPLPPEDRDAHVEVRDIDQPARAEVDPLERGPVVRLRPLSVNARFDVPPVRRRDRLRGHLLQVEDIEGLLCRPDEVVERPRGRLLRHRAPDEAQIAAGEGGKERAGGEPAEEVATVDGLRFRSRLRRVVHSALPVGAPGWHSATGCPVHGARRRGPRQRRGSAKNRSGNAEIR